MRNVSTCRAGLRRRELLGAGAALGALSLAGCATSSSGPSIGRVVSIIILIHGRRN